MRPSGPSVHTRYFTHTMAFPHKDVQKLTNIDYRNDLAIVGVTALGYPDESALSGYRFRLALASVAPVPLIPAQAETILAGKPINEATIAEAAGAAMEACTPIDDVRGSARYRKLMVRNLTRGAVTEVWEQISRQ